MITGGGDVIGQALERGIVDEFLCTSRRWRLGSARRCFGRVRATGTVNVMSARRATSSTHRPRAVDERELAGLLGTGVDVVPANTLKARIRDEVLGEAIPL